MRHTAALLALAFAPTPSPGVQAARWVASDPVLMVVPPEVPNPTMDRGCWVRITDRPGFAGRSFVLVGPVELRANDLAEISRSRRRIASAETGPNATAKLYARGDFTGPRASMAPSTRDGDVVHTVGARADRVRALRLLCSN